MALWQIGWGLLVWAVLISAFVMAIVALAKKTYYNSVLVHPRGGNQSGASPKVDILSGTGFAAPVTLAAGSTDSSGRISGTATALVSGALRVTFGTPYKVAPLAVVVTPLSSDAYDTPFYVTNIDVTGFTVTGTPHTGNTRALFSYIVL
jgi:hypothetical protein